MRRLIATTLLALVGSTSLAMAAQVIPRVFQLQVKALLVQIGARDLALAPARVPSHFVFDSFSVAGTPPALDLSFTDQRYLKVPTQARRHRVNFDASYFMGSVHSCASKARKTLEAAGKTIYSDGTSVWRCVRTGRGRLVKESASGHVAEKALADLIVSTGTIR